MDILYEISTLLNTGLNKERLFQSLDSCSPCCCQESLEALVGLCELGVNPEA